MQPVIVIEWRGGNIERKPYTRLRWKKYVRAMLTGSKIVSVSTEQNVNDNAT